MNVGKTQALILHCSSAGVLAFAPDDETLRVFPWEGKAGRAV